MVHARSRAPAWSAYWAAKAMDVPFVTTYHGAYSGKTKLKKRYNSVMAQGDMISLYETFRRIDSLRGAQW